MDKIEKLLRKISKPERQRLGAVLELLVKKDFKSLNINPIKKVFLVYFKKVLN